MPRKTKKEVKENNVIEKMLKFYVAKNLIIDISMIIIGIVFLCNPYGGVRTCEIVLAVVLIVSGLASIFEGTANKIIPLLKLNIIYGVISSVIGAIIIIKPLELTRIIVIAFGIWLIINGLLKIFYSSYLRESNEDSWLVTLVIGIVTILFGVLIALYNFDVTMTLVQITGLFLILYAILDLNNNLLFKKRKDEIIAIFKN